LAELGVIRLDGPLQLPQPPFPGQLASDPGERVGLAGLAHDHLRRYAHTRICHTRSYLSYG